MKYPQFIGNVATVLSNPLSFGGGGNGHYDGSTETHSNIVEAKGGAVVGLTNN